MWKEEGWRGFMAGNGTNCIRIVPYSAVQFGSYNLYKHVSSSRTLLLFYLFDLGMLDTICQGWRHSYVDSADNGWQHFFEKYPGAPLSPLERLVCGGIAGITSVFFTYPLDIVRTRLSIQSASFAALGHTPKDKLPGMWSTMAVMYKEEGGVPALYRGIIPTVAGVAPYVSFGFSPTVLCQYGWMMLTIS